MKPISPLLAVIALPLMFSQPLSAHEVPDPSITHNARDGIVKFYGAGGPHSAFKKVVAAFEKQSNVKVEIIAGPESTWSKKAQADADVLWGTAEQDITAFLETYKTFSFDNVMPIYVRPSIIAVKKGNPKNIHSFKDLLKSGVKIVVTEGSGVANTSGTGVWEDVAGRLGNLEDVKGFRKNIIGVGKGSGPTYNMFVEKDADAWITWPDWPARNPDTLEMIQIAPERTIWRDVNLVVAPDADPGTKEFIDFLTSDEGAKIMKTEGWVR